MMFGVCAPGGLYSPVSLINPVRNTSYTAPIFILASLENVISLATKKYSRIFICGSFKFRRIFLGSRCGKFCKEYIQGCERSKMHMNV